MQNGGGVRRDSARQQNFLFGAILIRSRWIVPCLVAALLSLVLRAAWLGDDAYITLRVVDNFINGYGLRWNVAERVQVYTHPLWMLLLSVAYFFTREAYYTTIFAGIAVTCAAFALLLLAGWAHRPTVWCVGLGLLCSKAFIEFSTAGLENPLAHLLIVLFFSAWLSDRIPTGRRVGFCWLIASLATLTRPDHLPLYIPALTLMSFGEARRKTIIAAALGLTPLVAWELFSLIYYGALAPNTALAKVMVGTIPASVIWKQGGYYFLDILRTDPLTLVLIIGAIAFGFASRDRRKIAIACGIALYLLYLLFIGGDFMSGRLFTAPLMMAACLLSTLRWRLRTGWAWVPVPVCLAVAWILPRSPLHIPTDASFQKIWHGVAEERRYYVHGAGIWSKTPEHPANMLVDDGKRMRRQAAGYEFQWIANGQPAEKGATSEKGYPVETIESIGFRGYYAGPAVYLIDSLGLSDPLLARLPPLPRGEFRPGHVPRFTPAGYYESLRQNQNQLRDPVLREFYDQLRLVTMGLVWTPQRWRAIWNINFGSLHRALKRHDPFAELARSGVPADAVLGADHGNGLGDWRNVWFGPAGLRICFNAPCHAALIKIKAENNDFYRVQLLKSGWIIAQTQCPPKGAPPLSTRSLDLPPIALNEGFDQIFLLPLSRQPRYILGGIELPGARFEKATPSQRVLSSS